MCLLTLCTLSGNILRKLMLMLVWLYPNISKHAMISAEYRGPNLTNRYIQLDNVCRINDNVKTTV